MDVQTRSENNGLLVHSSVDLAFAEAKAEAKAKAKAEAKRDPTVWKVSWTAQDGTRVRLVKEGERWIYEPILLSADILKE